MGGDYRDSPVLEYKKVSLFAVCILRRFTHVPRLRLCLPFYVSLLPRSLSSLPRFTPGTVF